jgi:DNA (cytosine-5)-methyltransferase 1
LSILGDHKPYEFPKTKELDKRLKDVLEPTVDDKFVLSDQAMEGFLDHNENHEKKQTGFV